MSEAGIGGTLEGKITEYELKLDNHQLSLPEIEEAAEYCQEILTKHYQGAAAKLLELYSKLVFEIRMRTPKEKELFLWSPSTNYCNER